MKRRCVRLAAANSRQSARAGLPSFLLLSYCVHSLLSLPSRFVVAHFVLCIFRRVPVMTCRANAYPRSFRFSALLPLFCLPVFLPSLCTSLSLSRALAFARSLASLVLSFSPVLCLLFVLSRSSARSPSFLCRLRLRILEASPGVRVFRVSFLARGDACHRRETHLRRERKMSRRELASSRPSCFSPSFPLSLPACLSVVPSVWLSVFLFSLR